MHHATIKPVIYGGIAARLTRVPAVVNAITGLGTVFIARGILASVRRAMVTLIYRISLGHRNQRIIFQNPNDRAYFVNAALVKPEDSALIRGAGVDMQRFIPTLEPAGIPIVVLPSRMIWDKGIAEFVAAARRLRAKHSGAALCWLATLIRQIPPRFLSLPSVHGEMRAWWNGGATATTCQLC